MPLITLTTDFGHKSYYKGALQGVLQRYCSGSTVCEISHEVSMQNPQEAAYIVRNACKEFPKGTFHLIAVDGNCLEGFVIIENCGHYFIAPNNGVLSLLFSQLPHHTYLIHPSLIPDSNAFVYKDVFAKVVKHIHLGRDINLIAEKTQSIVQLLSIQPVVKQDAIYGQVFHVDEYDNAVVNITRDQFEAKMQNRNFEISFGRFRTQKISYNYADVNDDGFVCIFNSAGYLEVAAPYQSAANLYGLDVRNNVTIQFN